MLTLNEKDIEYLDLRYKRIDDCEKDMGKTNESIHAIDKVTVAMATKLNIICWLTTAIAGGIIALVIKVFVGG